MKLNTSRWGSPRIPRPPLYLLSEICDKFGVQQRSMLGLLATHRDNAPVARRRTRTTPGCSPAGMYAIADFKRWIETNNLALGKKK
jgi:hypothetical protein